MTRIVHAPALELALTVPGPVLTVEAEYGSAVIEGSRYTAAHHQPHGPYAGRHTVEGGRPSPCNDPNIPVIEEGTILVSHLDLDTVGGVLRAQGRHGLFLRYATFWSLAEFVDVTGPHRVADAGASDEDVARLYAWWAYSKTLPRYPRDAVTDITADINEMCHALSCILEGDAAAIAAGKAFREAEQALNERTYKSHHPSLGIIGRVSEVSREFCNHLYTPPDGADLPITDGPRIVIGHNTADGTITLSISEPLEGFSCRELVQALWGDEAGGHVGIAGSPRGRVMSEVDVGHLHALVEEVLCDILSAKAFEAQRS